MTRFYFKKTVKLLSLVATVLGLSSCLNSEDPYTAGFVFSKPTSTVTMIYANNTSDSIIFFSYGNWSLTTSSSVSNWYSVSENSGKGGVVYGLPVTFRQNTYGESRYGQLKFTDTAHPGEASATIYYWQYATRGDGSLGNAADVSSISGTDGSLFTFSYDEQHRPLSVNISKDGSVLHSLSLSYNGADSMLTVRDKDKTLTGRFSRGYQPQQLIGSGDTIGYTSQYNALGYPVSTNLAFNLVHRTFNSSKAEAFLLNNQPLTPDSLHCADSITILNRNNDITLTQRYKMHYSSADNRHQSVDANQLIFGTEQCDPYQLLSLFRYARQTSIVSELTGATENDRILVSTTLNSDKSVSTMTVKRNDEEITYTFEY